MNSRFYSISRSFFVSHKNILSTNIIILFEISISQYDKNSYCISNLYFVIQYILKRVYYMYSISVFYFLFFYGIIFSEEILFYRKEGFSKKACITCEFSEKSC